LSPGAYLFVCDLWETIAARNELRLVGLALDLRRGVIDHGLSTLLLNVLRTASGADDSLSLADDVLVDGFRRLDEEADALRRSEREILRRRNTTLICQKLASLELHHANRLRQLQERVEKTTDDRIL